MKFLVLTLVLLMSSVAWGEEPLLSFDTQDSNEYFFAPNVGFPTSVFFTSQGGGCAEGFGPIQIQLDMIAHIGYEFVDINCGKVVSEEIPND